HCLEIGSAGGSPAPVGDPPTGTAESNLGKRPSPLARTVTPIPSGESPDGTGGSPVLPKTIFQTRSKKLGAIREPPYVGCYPLMACYKDEWQKAFERIAHEFRFRDF